MARLDVPDGPGGEAAMIWTLLLFPGVSKEQAASCAIMYHATQFVPIPEDVLPLNPPAAPNQPRSPSQTLLALGNSGYGVVASADAIIDLIATFY